MSQFLIQDSTLQDIGDAVRSKIDTQTITFPRYVAAYTFGTRTLTKSYGSYSFSNAQFNFSGAKTNLNSVIDTNEIDHWVAYWTSSNIESNAYSYRNGVILYYRLWENDTWQSHSVSYADSFKKYTVLPAGTYNGDRIDIDMDISVIPANTTISFDATMTFIPVKADGSYFLVDSTETQSWSLDETYTSASLLPVSKLADILNAIEAPSGGSLNFNTNTFYSLTLGRNSGLTVNTAITDLSQIIAFGWWYYDYLYFCYPAREKDSSTGRVPIYRFDPMRDSSRTTYDYLYLSGGKLYTVSNTVASGSNAGGFMIYTI